MADGVLVLLKVKAIANQFWNRRVGYEGEGSGVGFDGEWMTMSLTVCMYPTARLSLILSSKIKWQIQSSNLVSILLKSIDFE